MPLARPHRDPLPGETHRSPLGGCWIQDVFYPTNYWLPAGTTHYYIEWCLNLVGELQQNYPWEMYEPRGRDETAYEYRRRVRQRNTKYSWTIDSHGNFVRFTPGLSLPEGAERRKILPNPGGRPGAPTDPEFVTSTQPPNPINFFGRPSWIEYPVGTSTFDRFRGLQLFIEEVRRATEAGASNPYRYFLNPISAVPELEFGDFA